MPGDPVVVELGDVRLEAEVLGSGPEVVWLHGLTGSLAEAHPLVERLAESFTVLSYSTRGHGASTPLLRREDYGYGLIARDLQRMIAAAGFTHPVVAGGSHGAGTALRHEAMYPGTARALLLAAPGGNLLSRPAGPTWWLLRAATVLAERRGPDALVRLVTGPAADDLALQAARTHDLASLAAAMRHIAGQRVVDPARLADIRVPTVVAAWKGDPVLHPWAVACRLADLLPDATLQLVDRHPGLGTLEAADAAAAVMVPLLQRLVRSPAPR